MALRTPDRIRADGWCTNCGARADGVTTIEHKPWEDPPARTYHVCDACRVSVRERPFQQVMLEFLAEE